MKGQEKPKKVAKKPAQKTLKERRPGEAGGQRQGSAARRLRPRRAATRL